MSPQKREQNTILSILVLNRGKFIVWDPAKGLRLLSEDELGKIWLTKKCLALIPNSSFKLEKEDKRRKEALVTENN